MEVPCIVIVQINLIHTSRAEVLFVICQYLLWRVSSCVIRRRFDSLVRQCRIPVAARCTDIRASWKEVRTTCRRRKNKRL